MTLDAVYTVELWHPDRKGTFFRADRRSACPRQALALALQDVTEQGVAVDDTVRMWVKVAGTDDVESVAFLAGDIRCWLRESEQLEFVNRHQLSDLLK